MSDHRSLFQNTWKVCVGNETSQTCSAASVLQNVQQFWPSHLLRPIILAVKARPTEAMGPCYLSQLPRHPPACDCDARGCSGSGTRRDPIVLPGTYVAVDQSTPALVVPTRCRYDFVPQLLHDGPTFAPVPQTCSRIEWRPAGHRGW